jgi:hypothetical protein
MLVSVSIAEPNGRSVDRRETEVDGVLEPERPPDGVLRCLDRRVVTRAPSIVVQRDLSRERTRGERDGVLGIHSAELDTGGQDEHVRRKAMAALVGREPEPGAADTSLERPVHRSAAAGTAGIAASVTADERELHLDALAVPFEVRIRQVLVSSDLDPTDLGHRFLGPYDERH